LLDVLMTESVYLLKVWLRFVVSPVPNCEGPGAPSVWFENLTGTATTRPNW
jgi:hypothetical protein